jgi:dTDP-4-dehydrorhamnose 3,5-epimerase
VRRVDLDLPGVVLLGPRRHHDARGWLCESWSPAVHGALDFAPVQDNLARSRPGSLRGLHFQVPAQAKLIQVVQGRVYDVVLDLRPGSPTRGQWRSMWLDAAGGWQLFVPKGLAHGFCVADDEDALVHYRMDEAWAPGGGRTVAWSDPALGIPWPVRDPVLSAADAAAPALAELCRAEGWSLPAVGGREVALPVAESVDLT